MARERVIAVDGLEFRVRVPWGLMREFISELAEIEASGAGPRQREAMAEEAARRFLQRAIVDCRGLENARGRPVKWRPELVDELDAEVVAELLRRIAEPPGELGTKKGRSGWPLCGRMPRAGL